jgi:hypothetical protein
MKHFLPSLVALVLMLGALLGPGSAAAAGPEIITINTDITTPTGSQLTGTFVVQRDVSSGRATWTFSGMLNGKPVAANGATVERWSTSGTGTVELTAITAPGITLSSLPVRTITISVGNNGLITLLGVPLAISGPIRPPGAGNAIIYVTNAGRGARQITSLPNTAGDAPVSPELVAGSLLLAGAAAIYAGTRRSRRSSNN